MEISFIPNGPGGNNHMAQIKELKTQLAAFQGRHEPIKANNMPYEILDVSMDYEDKMLPVITLHAPNTDHQCFFQFEKPLAPFSHGEMDRHHASAQQVRKAKPAISLTLFYQKITGPPFAWASKRKQRVPSSSANAEKHHIDGHPPSSPLQQYNAYSC